ncbi:hypothetical protein [Streptomyces chartreusis]|uniref:hypothetical protein n=1 Tax=Streptomyces chartreusis TaxID=1969 RepID=UPI0038307357
MTIPYQPDEPGNAPAPLPPAIVSAILRDPDSPLYPSQIGVFCDDCGTEVSGDYMVSTEQTSAERLEVARAHLRTQGWVSTAAGDFCPPCSVSHPSEPRLFHLQRDHDVSGVSGTGRVANGVLWPDGTVSLRWIGERPSTVHWDRLADAEHVHGHGGATRIVWADEQP